MVSRVVIGFLLCALAVSRAILAEEQPTAAGALPDPELTIAAAIDQQIGERLALAGFPPAPLATDLNLLRRIMLDLAGRIPTAREAREYGESNAPDKRRALIERLLESPEFVAHQVNVLDAFLMQSRRSNLRNYLELAVAENRSWDRMFREMIVGESGDDEQSGAIQFLRSRIGDIDRLTNDVSVLFFGVNISCAQCHDHPLVHDWTQDHFFGMKSFFHRCFENGGFVGEREYGELEYKTVAGESRKTGLMFLSGKQLPETEVSEPSEEQRKQEKAHLEELKKQKRPPPAASYSRRARLVEAGLESENASYFARAIVNRTWQRLIGRGLVSPVDQLHSGNPASHPELLDWLARDLIHHGYDLRRLIGGIVSSDTYARSGKWDSASRPPAELHAVAIMRPLLPQQYASSLALAAFDPEPLNSPDASKKIEARLQFGRGFADWFELPGDEFQVGSEESLLLSNSDRAARELFGDGGDTLVARLRSCADLSSAAELAAWNVFNRPLADSERQLLVEYLEQRKDRLPEGYRQMVWAMMTSAECRFNY
jgi:hypothetical protein